MSLTRIYTNAESSMALSAIQKISQSLSRATAHISSGSRLMSAADDPSSISLFYTKKAELSGIRVGISNMQTAMSLLNTADTHMGNVMDSLISARDLAVRVSNSATLDASTVAALNAQYQSIKVSIGSVKYQQFNSINLFNTTTTPALAGATGLTIQTGPSATDTMVVKLSNTIITAANACTSLAGAGWAQTAITDATTALTALGEIDAVISAWSGQIASLGGQMHLVNMKLDEMQSREIITTNVISQVGDTDMAAEITEYTRLKILAESATAILAQANIMPQAIIQKLLG